MCKKISRVIYFSLSTNRKRKFLAKFCQVSRKRGIKTMGRRCFVGHDGAVVLWDELCSQYMDELEGRRDETGRPLPLLEDQLQFGWECFSSCDFQWPLTLWKSESLLSGDTALTGQEWLIFLILFTPNLCPWVGKKGQFFTPIQRLLVNITALWILQFSCVLDGSTSLWPNGSASVLHLFAGLSCAVAVSLWSSRGSREPFRSWLGALGWLQPLELLSEMGGGASTIGWEGPLDWTDSDLTWFAGGNGAPSIGWLELWLAIPVKNNERWAVWDNQTIGSPKLQKL